MGSPSRSKVPFSPWPRRARTDAGSDHFFFEFRNKPFRDGQWAPWAGRRKSLLEGIYLGIPTVRVSYMCRNAFVLVVKNDSLFILINSFKFKIENCHFP